MIVLRGLVFKEQISKYLELFKTMEARTSFDWKYWSFLNKKFLLGNGTVLTKQYSNTFKKWKLKNQNNILVMQFTL